MERARKHSLRQISAVSTKKKLSVPPPSPYEEGTVIADKYQLLSAIGEGGMGSIWRARNVVLHVDVAIKLISRAVASAEASKRLLVEARAAAQLDHPSIVRVHDFGTTDHDDPYIVMELLDGESLGQVLDRKGTLAPEAAVQMMLPVLGALSAAHGKGVVHRDIKPDNVILVSDESGSVAPKLVDFGIAKVEGAPVVVESDADRAEMGGQLARRLTQTGSFLGSPDYMAPEQARGDDVDERTDLWALSVVLYETMVGDVPFSDQSVEKVLMRVLLDDPAPTTTYGVGDASLWQAISKGLRKRKDERWQSARDMGKALATWLLTQGIDTDITGTSVRQQWLGQRVRKFTFGPGEGLADAVGEDDDDDEGDRTTPVSFDRISVDRLLTGSSQEGVAPMAPEAPTVSEPPTKAVGGVKRWHVIVAAVVLPLLSGLVTWVVSQDGREAPTEATTAAPTPSETAASTASSQPTSTASTGEPSGSASAESTAPAAPKVVAPRLPQRPVQPRPTAAPAPQPKPTPTKPAKPVAPGDLPLPDAPNF